MQDIIIRFIGGSLVNTNEFFLFPFLTHPITKKYIHIRKRKKYAKNLSIASLQLTSFLFSVGGRYNCSIHFHIIKLLEDIKAEKTRTKVETTKIMY